MYYKKEKNNNSKENSKKELKFIQESDFSCSIQSKKPVIKILDNERIIQKTNQEISCNKSFPIKNKRNKKGIKNQPKDLKKIDTLALENYRKFIEKKFSNLKNIKFISKKFIENLLQEIRLCRGDLSDNKIAEILYGTFDGSEAFAFATLKFNKFNKIYSLIDENVLNNWYFNLKREFPMDYFVFFNLINDYKLICAEKRVSDLVNKWNSYCSKVHSLGLNMETKKYDFIESVLKGTRIENMSFELSCKNHNHKKFDVAYKHLYRAVCPLCSRIEKSYSYQDFVRETELRNARFKFTESEFLSRINEELKKPRNDQKKVSEILFPFICNKHGEFFISMERIKNYNNWCAECYHESRRLIAAQIIARGKKFNFNLETPLSHINKLKKPSRKDYIWSCIYHPSFRFKSRPDEFSLDQKSCDICSGGKITNERIIRYLLSRLFNQNFGEKPTSLYEILPFDTVFSLLPNDYSTIKSYKLMHFDAFAYVDINIGSKFFNLSVAVEYWDREHASLEEYIDRFKHRSPRSGSFTDDYRHLKSSDNFKQNLKDNGLIDIYIVVKYPIQREDFLDFIISEFEQQIRKLFNISNYRFRSISNFNWRDLKQIDKLRQTYGDIIRFI